MAIRVQCPSCRGVFQARDELAGRRGKCPKCTAAIQVPAKAVAAPVEPARVAAASGRAPAVVAATTPAASAQPPNKQPAARRQVELLRELQTAFRGNIRPVRVSIVYRMGIVVCAVVMVLLPLAYLALIGVACFACYYHAVNDTGLLQMGAGRGRIIMVMVYVGPIVAGVIFAFFMLKPLLAQPLEMGRTRSLTRQGEPLLFAFVERVCQAVGSRVPSRIEVNWQLNAAAGTEPGWMRLFSDRLVLMIGAPLVAGLDAGQFAGVLAHEFGHFTQGAGRRLTFLVRKINNWFVKAVYQRDSWDQWLENSAGQWDFRVGWILQLAVLCVLVSRGVLWLLMMLGYVVSSFMLRQMELHADAHEARLVGGNVFESTTRRLSTLEVAYQVAIIELNRMFDQGALPDNLSLLMMFAHDQISPQDRQRIDRHFVALKTGWFDTHPAPMQRIAAAHREAPAGVFADGRPAADLFSDFSSLARNTTWDLYRSNFGSQFLPSMMRPTQELLHPEEFRTQPTPLREIPLD
jgi:hypothetical protein